jgi:hypothetical protein
MRLAAVVSVPVVDVGRVLVRVLAWLVVVRVGVFASEGADEGRIVRVRVVPVVVTVRMCVVEGLVPMPVPVAFGDVQVHSTGE